MYREFEEKDRSRLIMGITSWWMSILRAKLDPELIERLADALIKKGHDEVNVQNVIGNTGIDRFYIRHRIVIFPDDMTGEGVWMNIFDRMGNQLTLTAQGLTQHIQNCLQY